MGSHRDFPEEIITDILSRVPAKSVGRCRCLSKKWRILLSRPEFIRTHLNRSRITREESLILISGTHRFLSSVSLSNAHHLLDEITIPATRLSFADHPDSFTRVGASCDGLLLVEDFEGKEFVVNPITREMKEIPPWSFAKEHYGTPYGLGYDSATDDYKIVALCSYNAPTMYKPNFIKMSVCVCSLKNGTWKTVDSSHCDLVVEHIDSGVFGNGYVHWLASRTTDNNCAIVSFDLAEETFHIVPTPSSINIANFVFNHLIVLGGCLCMLNEVNRDIWMMKEYGVKESWEKFTINVPQGERIGTWPLCLLGQEQVVVFNGRHRIDMYNMKQGTLKRIVIDDSSDDDLYIEGSFLESLISLPGSNETDTGRE